MKSVIHGVSDKQVGRSPCGERGLKYFYEPIPPLRAVAPRAGSVD